MDYDFSKFSNKATDTEEWLRSEAALLRTGRATPSLVDNVKVDYYGSKSPLKNIASISVDDAKTLTVKPWNTDSILQIEQALRSSNLGVQAITEKDKIRIIFPDLTEERRQSLLKILNEKLEEAKVSLRSEREAVWRDIQDKEKEGEISEDEKFRYKDKLQDIMDEQNKKFQDIVNRKEREIKG